MTGLVYFDNMYRNIATYTKNGKQVVWLATWDKDGNRVEEEHEIKPHLFYEDVNATDSPWKSMYNKPLRMIEFDNTMERAEWIKNSLNTPLFEKLSPEKQYLLDTFAGQERDHEFIKYKLRTYFIDLEVEIDGCFPEPEFADYPLNVISIYDSLTDVMHIWTYRKDIDKWLTQETVEKMKNEVINEYEPNIKGIVVYKFDKEFQMLRSFLDFWKQQPPDIISGWNIDGGNPYFGWVGLNVNQGEVTLLGSYVDLDRNPVIAGRYESLIPEPSSARLLLVGGALRALRRRRLALTP